MQRSSDDELAGLNARGSDLNIGRRSKRSWRFGSARRGADDRAQRVALVADAIPRGDRRDELDASVPAAPARQTRARRGSATDRREARSESPREITVQPLVARRARDGAARGRRCRRWGRSRRAPAGRDPRIAPLYPLVKSKQMRHTSEPRRGPGSRSRQRTQLADRRHRALIYATSDPGEISRSTTVVISLGERTTCVQPAPRTPRRRLPLDERCKKEHGLPWARASRSLHPAPLVSDASTTVPCQRDPDYSAFRIGKLRGSGEHQARIARSTAHSDAIRAEGSRSGRVRASKPVPITADGPSRGRARRLRCRVDTSGQAGSPCSRSRPGARARSLGPRLDAVPVALRAPTIAIARAPPASAAPARTPSGGGRGRRGGSGGSRPRDRRPAAESRLRSSGRDRSGPGRSSSSRRRRSSQTGPGLRGRCVRPASSVAAPAARSPAPRPTRRIRPRAPAHPEQGHSQRARRSRHAPSVACPNRCACRGSSRRVNRLLRLRRLALLGRLDDCSPGSRSPGGAGSPRRSTALLKSRRPLPGALPASGTRLGPSTSARPTEIRSS